MNKSERNLNSSTLNVDQLANIMFLQYSANLLLALALCLLLPFIVCIKYYLFFETLSNLKLFEGFNEIRKYD